MADTVRTFVAVPVPGTPSLARISRTLKELGGPVRVVDLQGLHLTLSFLGDTSWSRVADVSRIVAEVCAEHSALDASLSGLGAFPHPRSARVVWTGLEEAGELSRIAVALSARLGEVGFPIDGRAFVPHVTLARIKGRPSRELSELIDRFQSASLGELHVDRLVYYQSELTSRGPVYTVLSEHELA